MYPKSSRPIVSQRVTAQSPVGGPETLPQLRPLTEALRIRAVLIIHVPRFIWIFLCCLWTAFVFFSSTSLAGRWAELLFRSLVRNAGVSSGEQVFHLILDKGFHVFMFVILALLLSRVFVGTAGRTIGAILAIVGAVAISSEVLQSLFPDRDPEIRDVLINFAGAIVGLTIDLLLVEWRRSRV